MRRAACRCHRRRSGRRQLDAGTGGDGEPAGSAQTTYTIDSVGSVQVRLESTPNGYGSSDGTCMDADLVPGKSGVAHDTEFIVAGALGSASGYRLARPT